jgi:hypothetical protein
VTESLWIPRHSGNKGKEKPGPFPNICNLSETKQLIKNDLILLEDNRGEYDQNTLYNVWKCHNETHYFAYAKEEKITVMCVRYIDFI